MNTGVAIYASFLSTCRSMLEGLRLTFAHLIGARKKRRQVSIQDNSYFDQPGNGIATLQYPYEQLPVPDTGRYRLHNEIDDCIVCDKCAKVCPVDCITIESIKSPVEFGRTSDGTPKRIYAAKFDIDMGKCCFCGLCTTVCPTECLTMTKVYDFSVLNIQDHVFSFANMTKEEIEEKQRAASESIPPKTTTEQKKPAPFKPRIKPPGLSQ